MKSTRIRLTGAVILAMTAFLVSGPALARADTLVARATVKGSISPYPGGSIAINIAVFRFASGLITGTVNISGVDDPVALLLTNAKGRSLDFTSGVATIRTAPVIYSDLRGWKPGSGALLVRRKVTCIVTISAKTVAFQVIDVSDNGTLQQVAPIGLRPGGTISLLNKLPPQ